jgi:hypothetical protein
MLSFDWNFVKRLLRSLSLVLLRNLKSLFTLSSRVGQICRHQFKCFVLHKKMIVWLPNGKNKKLEAILYTHSKFH